ncbi:TOG array regulator of axonemal microtubules protein 2-like [Amia ocellicauda]|uniref:TOG array regulator of axonemal microtubules protein 2-like n=1 Tax=Amia ocellicauda TaxID=2972642 RepID=UPI003464C338
MEQSEFTAGPVRVPVAVYCGSVPHVRPGHQSQRSRSVDSPLRLPSNGLPHNELLPPQLPQGPGREASPERQRPPEARMPQRRRHSLLPIPINTRTRSRLSEPRPHSLANHTTPVSGGRDTVRAGGGVESRAGGAMSAGRMLGEAVPDVCPAPQRPLSCSRPLPPITPGSSREGGGGGSGNQGAQDTEEECPEEVLAALQSVRSSAQRKRMSLSGTLLPPIIRLDSAHTQSPSQPHSQSAQPNTEEAEDVNLRLSPESDDLPLQVPPRPLTGLSRSSSPDLPGQPERENAGQDVSRSLTQPGTDSLQVTPTGSADPARQQGPSTQSEVPATLSKSAQEKVRNRWRMALERQRGDREGESETDRGADTEALAQPPPRRASLAAVLQRRPSRPTLPPPHRRHSSVLPGSRLLPESQEEGRDSDSEEPRPLSNPEQQLRETVRGFQLQDWEVKLQCLTTVCALAAWHPGTLLPQLPQLIELLKREVLSLRSGVSRAAMRALGRVCGALGGAVEGQLEEVCRVLLLRAGDASEFLREEAQKTLRAAVGSANPARVLGTLIVTGASHRNPASRCVAAELMLWLVESEGAERVMSGVWGGKGELLITLVRLAQDSQQDTRFYGRSMLTVLMSHPEFDRQAQRCLPTCDLHFLSSSFRNQVMRGSVSEPPSARGRRSSRASFSASVPGLTRLSVGDALSEMPVGGSRAECKDGGRGGLREAAVCSLRRGERLEELRCLLTGGGHPERARGVDLLLELCTQHPLLISNNIQKVWDWFGPRVQDANRKVCLKALDTASQLVPLLGNSITPVLSPLATAAIDNFNSKHPGTAPSAAALLDCLITHCDQSLLLQPLASRVQQSSGQAVQEVTERLAVLVESVAPVRPSVVERHVLPALWHLIGQLVEGGARWGGGKVVRLAQSLWDVLPDSLRASSKTRPPVQQRTLWDLLRVQQGGGDLCLPSVVDTLAEKKDGAGVGEQERRKSGEKGTEGEQCTEGETGEKGKM